MEDSVEDVFSDSISEHSTRGKGDYINLSPITTYHSAQDLGEKMDEEVEFSEKITQPLQGSNCSSPKSPKSCPKMFTDGVRRVDFVLAWVQPTTKNQLQTRQAEEASRKREIFEKNLNTVGLELERDHTGRHHFIKIHAPHEVLRQYCEIMKMRMPMKELEGHDDTLGKHFDLGKEVRSFLSKLTSCITLDSSVFARDRFQPSAEYSRDKSYLFNEEADDFFSAAVRTLVVDFILERQRFSEDESDIQSVGIKKLLADGVYKAAYPLHDGDYQVVDGSLRNLLYTEWAQISKWIMFQPIDQVKEYFGVKFALYFAWLGFYTHMLIPASIVGLICFAYGCLTMFNDRISTDICDNSDHIVMCPRCDRSCDYWKLSDTCTYARITYLFDNPVTVFFAMFMSFWATLFLELWKRYSASMAHRWGLTGYTAQSEHARPQYLARLAKIRNAKCRTNVVTGAKEPYAPFLTCRLPAICLSFSVVALLIVLAVAAVFGVVLYRMSLLASFSLLDDTSIATQYAVIIIPATAATINLVCIMVFNYIYDWLAVYLTELELLRTQSEFDDSLTIKIYLFQFVNYYTSIMYIAFLKGKFVGYPSKYNRIFGYRQEECNPGGCLMELCIQLAIIMVGQQAVMSVWEMLYPLLLKWYNTFMLATGLETQSSDEDVVDSSTLSKQWTEDYKLLDWGDRGLFYEYLEMVIQYGFVTIFVAAFPLAPIFALINNVMEMRLDARKFLMYYRRPVPLRAPNIGVWFRILDVLGKIAVLSNAVIIAFSSNFIPRMVYMYSVNLKNHTDEGFLSHSLAYFDTRNFTESVKPIHSTFENVTICRYFEYRNPPWSYKPYKRPDIYWKIMVARLTFIVLFQNLVSLLMIVVQWLIPDIPSKLQDQIKRETFLTSEMIIKQETLRAQRLRGGSPDTPKAMIYSDNELNNSALRRRRLSNGNKEQKHGAGESMEMNDIHINV